MNQKGGVSFRGTPFFYTFTPLNEISSTFLDNMRAIQITAPKEIKIVKVETPYPGPSEVLVKIKYVGFCGSDLSSFLGKNPMVKYPVIPGHEVAGRIQKVGGSVPDSIVTGQDVTVIPYTSCGECASCRRGRSNACQFNQTLGVQRNGAMSEYLVVPWTKILSAKGLSMKELAVIEPLTVGFHAVSRGRVEKTDLVAVLGCGIIGIGAILGAKQRGSRVIAIDVDDSKLEMAKKLGADFAVNSLTENLNSKLEELTDGQGPDVIIEAAGQTATYLAAINNVAFTGRVVCIGYAKDEIAFATKLFVQKEIDILGSRNADNHDFEDVIKLLSSGSINIEDLLSEITVPEKAMKAVKNWASKPGSVFKILVDFDR